MKPATLIGMDLRTKISLSVAGRESPSTNWLIISGKIRLAPPGYTLLPHNDKLPLSEWKFKSTCLTINEVARLAEWFRLLHLRLFGSRTPRLGTLRFPTELAFTEPNLVFLTADGRDVWVFLKHECKPPRGGRDRLLIPADRNDYGRFADQLEAQIAMFPLWQP